MGVGGGGRLRFPAKNFNFSDVDPTVFYSTLT
jgi:hypothetical protein